MNEQNKFRNLWFAVISLFVLNVGTLGWIFFKNQGHEPPVGPVIIEEALAFDNKQISEFKPLKLRHFETVIPLRKAIQDDKNSLFDWLKSGGNDSTAFNNHLASLSLKVTKNERITFLHFKEIRDLCTPEQQKIFDEVLIEKFKHHGAERNRKDSPPPPINVPK
jgi:periplasmic protein CpxP/Spy